MLANLGFDRRQSQPSGALHGYCKGENLDYLYTLWQIKEIRKRDRAGARAPAARGKDSLPEARDGGGFRQTKAKGNKAEMQQENAVLLAERQ